MLPWPNDRRGKYFCIHYWSPARQTGWITRSYTADKERQFYRRHKAVKLSPMFPPFRFASHSFSDIGKSVLRPSSSSSSSSLSLSLFPSFLILSALCWTACSKLSVVLLTFFPLHTHVPARQYEPTWSSRSWIDPTHLSVNGVRTSLLVLPRYSKPYSRSVYTILTLTVLPSQ